MNGTKRSVLRLAITLISLSVVLGDLKIISRADWNAQTAKNELEKLNSPIQRIVILHTAGVDCSDEETCAQQTRNIQEYHMSANKLDDIGYNFLIGNDGNVYEGRGWQQQGASVRGYNAGTISIAFIGNFKNVAPTEAALNAAKLLLEKGIELGRIAADYNLYGHRQFQPTESPGNSLYKIIQQWPHWTRSVI